MADLAVTVPKANRTQAIETISSWRGALRVRVIGEDVFSVGLMVSMPTTPLSVGPLRNELNRMVRALGGRVGVKDEWLVGWQFDSAPRVSSDDEDLNAAIVAHEPDDLDPAILARDRPRYDDDDLGPNLSLVRYLPDLRRLAGEFAPSQEFADEVIRRLIARIGEDPTFYHPGLPPRVAAYQALYQLWLDELATAPVRDTDNHISLARMAVLLTTGEGLDQEEAASVLGLPTSDIASLIADLRRDLPRQASARVLIIEDDPTIAEDLRSIVQEGNHVVVGVVQTAAQAVQLARLHRPDIVLGDADLGDGPSGLDAVFQIRRFAEIRVIFVTEYPERLLTGRRHEPTFVITKPYLRGTVAEAISQAIMSGPLPILDAQDIDDTADDLEEIDDGEALRAGDELETEFDRDIDTGSVDARGGVDFDGETSDESLGEASPDPRQALPSERSISAMSLAPLPGPVDADVVDGALRRTPRAIMNASVAQASVEALRMRHHRTAERFHGDMVGRNLGNAFNARMDEIRLSLSEPLTETTGVDLGVQAEGLMRMTAAIDAELGEGTAADIAIFIDDVMKLAWMFPEYQAFAVEARSREPMAAEARSALFEVSHAIEHLPVGSVEPELRDEVAATRMNAELPGDPVADLALQRGIGNILRGVGRFLKRHIAGMSSSAGKEFDETAGKAFVKYGLTLLGSTAVFTLIHFFPAEFQFAAALMKNWIAQ